MTAAFVRRWTDKALDALGDPASGWGLLLFWLLMAILGAAIIVPVILVTPA